MNSHLFLSARNVKPAENHHQIREVYGDNSMSHIIVINELESLAKGTKTCLMKNRVSYHHHDDLMMQLVNEKL